MKKQSKFICEKIRNLKGCELIYFDNLQNFINNKNNSCVIGSISKILSNDNITRPLILTKDILDKIENKHGRINMINMIINANNWDFAIKDIDKTEGKICLIKHIPNSENILIIGAKRKNGFFTLSHYEAEIIQPNQLKSLLGRGDFSERMPDHNPLSLPI